jgi:hypothetical protein
VMTHRRVSDGPEQQQREEAQAQRRTEMQVRGPFSHMGLDLSTSDT